MTATDRLSRLDIAARLMTVLAIAVYGVGFLVLLLHHSQYGILQFSLLKARIAAAGAVFLFLLGIPTASAVYYFSRVGLLQNGEIRPGTSKKQNLRILCHVFYFYPYCYFLAIFSRFLFVSPFGEIRGWGLLFSSVSMALFFLGTTTLHKFVEKVPGRCVVLAGLTSASLLIILLRYGDLAFFMLSAWYYAGPLFVATFFTKPSPYELSKENWGLIGLLTLSILLFPFSTYIYGAIKPAYGGGAPIPIVLYLAQEVPPAGTGEIRASLVDQTDSGFYLVRAGENEAFYFPRTSVAAIRFLKETK